MNFVNSDRLGQKPRIMKSGDLIIAYERHDSMDHFYLATGKILNNKFGAFHHNDFIGKPFGSRIRSKSTNGWMYALEPTPELWSMALHTRTQIVNEMDACVVIMNLDLFPGCTVVESGTGSGCMTLALARTVAPLGRVFTFEFNPVRADTARAEFESLGVGHLVQVTCRDVCGKFNDAGGGFLGVEPLSADAVFLDLPEPWLAIEHALHVLKPNRPICSYSPCIEQVMKTTEQMRKLGFHSIRMMEVRQRPFDGRAHEFENVDTGRTALDASLRRKKDTQLGVEVDESTPGLVGEQQGRDEVEEESDTLGKSIQDEEGPKKKIRTELNSRTNPVKSDDIDSASDVPAAHAGLSECSAGDGTKTGGESVYHHRTRNHYRPTPTPSSNVLVARPLSSMKGHTAFLTFAVAPTAAFVPGSWVSLSPHRLAANTSSASGTATAAVTDTGTATTCSIAVESTSEMVSVGGSCDAQVSSSDIDGEGNRGRSGSSSNSQEGDGGVGDCLLSGTASVARSR